MDGSLLPLAIATLMVVVGVVGAVLPGLPGVPLVYAGLLVAAWADDFQRVGWVVLLLLGVLHHADPDFRPPVGDIGARRRAGFDVENVAGFLGQLADVG